MSALSHIFRKETTKKSTSELQALKFKHMLGVERSYLSFKMNEYHVSVEELEKVILFLDARVKEANEDEVLLKVKVYQQKIEEVIRNRIGKLDEL
jgi:adenylate cyclase class IV